LPLDDRHTLIFLMGETGITGAEGATAPETLRHLYRQDKRLWREYADDGWRITEEVSWKFPA
tara:strand:- start:282 stop:467 length:186 start_codon:yes stop_codon:yes gene_type:complete